jgi:hypothetical protein
VGRTKAGYLANLKTLIVPIKVPDLYTFSENLWDVYLPLEGYEAGKYKSLIKKSQTFFVVKLQQCNRALARLHNVIFK